MCVTLSLRQAGDQIKIRSDLIRSDLIKKGTEIVGKLKLKLKCIKDKKGSITTILPFNYLY
jgi:hypothetical protein